MYMCILFNVYPFSWENKQLKEQMKHTYGRSICITFPNMISIFTIVTNIFN